LVIISVLDAQTKERLRSDPFCVKWESVELKTLVVLISTFTWQRFIFCQALLPD